MKLSLGRYRNQQIAGGPSALPSRLRGRRIGTALLALAALAGATWRLATLRVPSDGAPAVETPAQFLVALERTAEADPRPRAAYEGLGAACLRLGHFMSARAAFRRAEALGSDSPWLRHQLAWCALNLDRRTEACRQYRHLLRLEPDRPEGYLRLAAAALRMGEPAAARAALRGMPRVVRQALLGANAPDTRLQLVRYVALLDGAGEPGQCLDVARRAIARLPNDASGYTAAAGSSLRLGRPRDALRWLQNALQLAPRRADVHALRGDALLALADPRRHSEARAAYARAVELLPALGPAQYRLGQLALGARRWDEAARAFAAAQALGTEPVAALRGMARAAEGAGRPVAAAAHWAAYYEKAGDTSAARRFHHRLRNDPRAALAADLALADLDVRERRVQEAISRLEAAARRAPGSADVWQALARAYRRFGRVHDAVAAWQRVAALDAASAPDAYRELAGIAESGGDYDAAERHYDSSLRLRPDDVTVHRLYGTLLLARRGLGDRLPRAIAELERAAALDPTDAAAFAALGRAYEAAGRGEEALFTLRHAIDLAPGAGAPYLALGRLAVRLGRNAEGGEVLAMYRRYRRAQQELDALRASLAAQPRDPAVRRALGDYYLAARDFSRAATEYERSLTFGAASLPRAEQRAIRARLAITYDRLARREDAAVQLTLAGGRRPDSFP